MPLERVNMNWKKAAFTMVLLSASAVAQPQQCTDLRNAFVDHPDRFAAVSTMSNKTLAALLLEATDCYRTLAKDSLYTPPLVRMIPKETVVNLYIFHTIGGLMTAETIDRLRTGKMRLPLKGGE
jgi:hypothetical protein